MITPLIFTQFLPWIRWKECENEGKDQQFKKLLIVKQIFLVSIIRCVTRTVWWIWILMFECNGLNGDLSIFFSSMLVLQVLLRVSWNLSLVVYISLSLMSLVATLLLPYETKGRPMQVSASKCLPSCKNVRGISWVLLVLYELILRWNYPFSFSFFFLLGNVTKWLYLLRTP